MRVWLEGLRVYGPYPEKGGNLDGKEGIGMDKGWGLLDFLRVIDDFTDLDNNFAHPQRGVAKIPTWPALSVPTGTPDK